VFETALSIQEFPPFHPKKLLPILPSGIFRIFGEELSQLTMGLSLIIPTYHGVSHHFPHENGHVSLVYPTSQESVRSVRRPAKRQATPAGCPGPGAAVALAARSPENDRWKMPKMG